MPKKSSQYEDWFQHNDFAPLELALLMAEICPDWPLAKDILELVENGGDLPYEEFSRKYSHLPQQWKFYKRFLSEKKRVFQGINAGKLRQSEKSQFNRISRDRAIEFVVKEAKKSKDKRRYVAFNEAAMAATLPSKEKKEGDQPASAVKEKALRWWKGPKLDDLIATKVAGYREKNLWLHDDGNPNKTRLAEDLAEVINAIAKREERRPIAVSTIRVYLGKIGKI